jgi:hypothetical protein
VALGPKSCLLRKEVKTVLLLMVGICRFEGRVIRNNDLQPETTRREANLKCLEDVEYSMERPFEDVSVVQPHRQAVKLHKRAK